MIDNLFRGLFDTDMTVVITPAEFLTCLGVSLGIGLILAALYLAILILAVTGSEHTMGLLMATLFASIAVPVFIYVVQLAMKAFQKKSE